MIFRNINENTTFSLYEEGKRSFQTEVKLVNNDHNLEDMMFGIDKKDINNFVNDLLALEVNGRKFRTKYLIPYQNASPWASNFMWTILSNKERKEVTSDIMYIKPTAEHWIKFSQELSIHKKFNFWIDKAFTQVNLHNYKKLK